MISLELIIPHDMHPTCTPSSLEDVRALRVDTELTEVRLLAGLSLHFCCHIMCPVKQ